MEAFGACVRNVRREKGKDWVVNEEIKRAVLKEKELMRVPERISGKSTERVIILWIR